MYRVWPGRPTGQTGVHRVVVDVVVAVDVAQLGEIAENQNRAHFHHVVGMHTRTALDGSACDEDEEPEEECEQAHGRWRALKADC